MKRRKYAMTYVVWFEKSWTLKVGRAWKWSRIEHMIRNGGYIIVCARNTDETWEREALKVLRRWFKPAFHGWRDAEWVLGAGGSGFTECFYVEPEDVQLALDRCFEGFARGNDQSVNETTHDQREGFGSSRPSSGRRKAHGAVAVAEPRPVGPRSDGPRVDRQRAVSDRGTVDGGREDDRAPADADGGGLPHDVQRERHRVDSPVASAEDGPAADEDQHARTSRRSSMDVHGCGAGERGRAREGARASTRAGASGGRGASGGVGRRASGPRRARASTGTPDAAGRATDVLRRPHAARGGTKEVWPLPGRPEPSGRMADQAGVRGEVGHVPRGDRER